MESQEAQIPRFENIANEKLNICSIIQKLSAFEVENMLRKIDGNKVFDYDKIHLLVPKSVILPLRSRSK